ncbi:T-cell-specific guanine nucleotide triphosphate-binding protein 2-like [Branchiostoma floridae x Branchiostoma belcheri]
MILEIATEKVREMLRNLPLSDDLPEDVDGEINEKFKEMLRNLSSASGTKKTKIMGQIQDFVDKNMEAWKKQKVYLGIVGDPGAGKSTFINSFRGLKAKAPGVAEVGLGHTTLVPTDYSHPARPDNFVLVDFPGVLLKKGTGKERDFDIQQYLDEHGRKMEQCHMFVVFTSGRIQHNAVQIGMKARDMGKTVLFVRSQFDIDVMKRQDDDPEYFDDKTEADLMKELRQDYIKVLKDVGWKGEVNPKDVFIISGRLKNVLEGSWDIPKLRTAIIEALDTLQKMIVINTCRDFSKATIKKRGDVFKLNALFVAMATTAGSFVPYTGIGAVPVTLVATYHQYKEGFGLTEDAMEQLAMMTDKSLEDLKTFFLKKLLGKTKLQKDIALPVIGAIITAPMAYFITRKVLHAMISRMEECAGELFDYAFKETKV